MNKLCCLIIMLFTCGVCVGQNLVLNPSFEDTVQCPGDASQIDRATGWSSYSISPDYYNPCDTNVFWDVPYNFLGYQVAATGVSYGGFASYANNGLFREIMGTQLLQPLVVGQKYFASLRVSRGKGGANGAWNMASNKLGIRFTMSPYVYFVNPIPIDNIAQVYTDSIVTDTVNWVTISGSFIADSAYQYVCFGNLFDDANTSIMDFTGGLTGGAYYYIDDVCVSTDSLTCNSTVGINEVNDEDELILFPNPFVDNINISTKTNQPFEIIFLDVTSRNIFHKSFTNSTSINTQQLAKGIYLYEVRNKNGVIKKGKIVKD